MNADSVLALLLGFQLTFDCEPTFHTAARKYYEPNSMRNM